VAAIIVGAYVVQMAKRAGAQVDWAPSANAAKATLNIAGRPNTLLTTNRRLWRKPLKDPDPG